MKTRPRRIASVLVLSLIAFNVMSVVAGADPSEDETANEVISEEVVGSEVESAAETPIEPEADVTPLEEGGQAPHDPEEPAELDRPTTMSGDRFRDVTVAQHAIDKRRGSAARVHVQRAGAKSNGDVKFVDAAGLDLPPNNVPHLPCTFYLQFFNWDPGEDIDWTIESQPPTSPANQVVLSGSLTADGTGFGQTGPLTPDFTGYTPGGGGTEFHIKLSATGDSGQNKQKTVKVEDCRPGSIQIKKVVTGTGASTTESFAFTGEIATSLVHNGTQSKSVAPGTYTVSENLTPAQTGAGWTLTGISCDDGASATPSTTSVPTATFKVDPAETVICTFTNNFIAPATPMGTLEVDKVVSGTTTPSLLNHDFDLADNSPDFAVADMSHNDAVQSFQVPAGTPFTLTETITATESNDGWSFTSLDCGAAGTSLVPTLQLSVPANTTVRCTFNNLFTQPTGTLIVDKVLTGGGDPSQLFQFTDNSPDLTMVDIAGNTPLATSTFQVPVGDYKIQETILGPLLTAGWTLTSVACNDNNSTGTVNSQSHGQADFEIENGETVTCTFTNNFDQPTGTIQIEKIVTGVGAPAGEDFDFDGEIDTDLQDGGTANKVVNAPGTYTVEEILTPAQLAAGWSLTGIDCDDDASNTPSTAAGNTATFKVDSGETVECEFTNNFLAPAAPQGSIQIVKALAAGSDTPPGGENFPFTGAIATTLQVGGSSAVVPVTPGPHTVTEGTLPADWTLDDITCTSSDAVDLTLNTVSTATKQVTMNVSDNEDVVCTFHNLYTEPPGTLEIDKVLDPTSDPGAPNDSFGFTGALPATLQVGDTTGPQTLTAGPYSQTESTIPTGWTLTDITCSDQTSVTNLATGTADVQIAPGEAEKCTFMNKWTAPPAPPPPPPPPPPGKGVIIVDKVTDPVGDPTSFGFSLTGGAVNENFNLTDTAAPFVSGDIDPDTYNVSETLPAGWSLTSATCDDGSLPGAIALAEGETVTCTFANTKLGTISVEKQTLPDGSPDTFDFTGALTATLSDDGTSSLDVLPGSYQVTEEVPDGWDLLTIDCTSDPTGDSAGDASSATASFEVAAGESITCVFTNELIPVVEPTRIDNPGTPGEKDPPVENRDPSEPADPPSVLPFTGSDIALVSAIGLVLVGLGTALASWRRKANHLNR